MVIFHSFVSLPEGKRKESYLAIGTGAISVYGTSDMWSSSYQLAYGVVDYMPVSLGYDPFIYWGYNPNYKECITKWNTDLSCIYPIISSIYCPRNLIVSICTDFKSIEQPATSSNPITKPQQWFSPFRDPSQSPMCGFILHSYHLVMTNIAMENHHFIAR